MPRLTLPEVALCLDHDLEKVRPPVGARVFSGPEERDEYVRRLREMTPLERLRLARDGRV